MTLAAIGGDGEFGGSWGELDGLIEDEAVAGGLSDRQSLTVEAKFDADFGGVASGRIAKQYVGIS